jgi:hypothetical protein
MHACLDTLYIILLTLRHTKWVEVVFTSWSSFFVERTSSGREVILGSLIGESLKRVLGFNGAIGILLPLSSRF